MTQTVPVLPDPLVRPMVGLDVACRALGVSRNTAYQLIKDNAFPVPVRRVGGSYKVATAALVAFIDAGSPINS